MPTRTAQPWTRHSRAGRRKQASTAEDLTGFPGVLLPRWPLRACCYRRGSADAARSRATDPATARADPAAVLGLRRCTARATRRTPNTAAGASLAIASTVSRRGWRRPDRTPMTIPTTEKATSYRDRWRAVSVCVPAAAGALVPGLRSRSLCCRRIRSTSARAGASVPRPHAISPEPAAPAHAARARCRRPAAQCPAPTAAWVTTGATADTHPDVPEGLAPSRRSIKGARSAARIASASTSGLSASSPGTNGGGGRRPDP